MFDCCIYVLADSACAHPDVRWATCKVPPQHCCLGWRQLSSPSSASTDLIRPQPGFVALCKSERTCTGTMRQSMKNLKAKSEKLMTELHDSPWAVPKIALPHFVAALTPCNLPA